MGPPCWKEDKGRLAFEDRFQYHEWTFKQACISSLLRSLASSSTTSLLPPPFSVVLPSTMTRLGYFPFRPSIRIFSCILLRGKKLSRETMDNP